MYCLDNVDILLDCASAINFQNEFQMLLSLLNLTQSRICNLSTIFSIYQANVDKHNFKIGGIDKSTASQVFNVPVKCEMALENLSWDLQI